MTWAYQFLQQCYEINIHTACIHACARTHTEQVWKWGLHWCKHLHNNSSLTKKKKKVIRPMCAKHKLSLQYYLPHPVLLWQLWNCPPALPQLLSPSVTSGSWHWQHTRPISVSTCHGGSTLCNNYIIPSRIICPLTVVYVPQHQLSYNSCDIFPRIIYPPTPVKSSL